MNKKFLGERFELSYSLVGYAHSMDDLIWDIFIAKFLFTNLEMSMISFSWRDSVSLLLAVSVKD